MSPKRYGLSTVLVAGALAVVACGGGTAGDERLMPASVPTSSTVPEHECDITALGEVPAVQFFMPDQNPGAVLRFPRAASPFEVAPVLDALPFWVTASLSASEPAIVVYWDSRPSDLVLQALWEIGMEEQAVITGFRCAPL